MSDAPKNYKLKKLNFESHQNEGVSKKQTPKSLFYKKVRETAL